MTKEKFSLLTAKLALLVLMIINYMVICFYIPTNDHVKTVETQHCVHVFSHAQAQLICMWWTSQQQAYEVLDSLQDQMLDETKPWSVFRAICIYLVWIFSLEKWEITMVFVSGSLSWLLHCKECLLPHSCAVPLAMRPLSKCFLEPKELNESVQVRCANTGCPRLTKMMAKMHFWRSKRQERDEYCPLSHGSPCFRDRAGVS